LNNLSSGKNEITVQAKDGAGNSSPPATTNIFSDAPLVLNPIGNKSVYVASARGKGEITPADKKTARGKSALPEEDEKALKKPVPQFEPGQMIIKFKPEVLEMPFGKRIASAEEVQINVEAIKNLNKKFGLLNVERIYKKEDKQKLEFKKQNLAHTYLFKFPKDRDAETIVKEYKSDPHVEYAEPNYIFWIMHQEVTPAHNFKNYK